MNEREHFANVRKVTRGTKYYGMWRGYCRCGYSTQYWAWGATLGRMLEHLWKESHG